jgi:hypothetical protein
MKHSLSQDLNLTLAQLLKNEEALSAIQEDPEFCYERTILERTQVSLAAHLSHIAIHQKNRLRPSRKEKLRAVISYYTKNQ